MRGRVLYLYSKGALHVNVGQHTDGMNFSYWKEQMRDYLTARGQIDPIENVVAPTTLKPEEWNRLDRTACAKVWMHLS